MFKIKGILLILGACLVWGFIFVIPGFMEGFSPLEVALGRYLFYGIISCLLMFGRGFHKWKSFSWPIFWQALRYALIVNILYYYSIVVGLRYSNPSVIALIIGFSPICIAFYSNWRERECEFKQLFIPCLLMAIGLVLVNWSAFTSLSPIAGWEYGFGLFCGFFSLMVWNWYVFSNARFLRNNPSIQSSDWANLIGIGTLIWVIVIGMAISFIKPSIFLEKAELSTSSLMTFLLGSLALGSLCSWVGSFLWNKGSQLLPLSFSGQLTIFETIFGLVFIFFFEQRLPSIFEAIGILSIFVGIGHSLQLFSKSEIHEEKSPIHSLS